MCPIKIVIFIHNFFVKKTIQRENSRDVLDFTFEPRVLFV